MCHVSMGSKCCMIFHRGPPPPLLVCGRSQAIISDLVLKSDRLAYEDRGGFSEASTARKLRYFFS